MTKTYKVTYIVTMDSEVEYPETVARFWVGKVIENPKLKLPDFLGSVETIPSVEEVIIDNKIIHVNKPKPKGK